MCVCMQEEKRKGGREALSCIVGPRWRMEVRGYKGGKWRLEGLGEGLDRIIDLPNSGQ